MRDDEKGTENQSFKVIEKDVNLSQRSNATSLDDKPVGDINNVVNKNITICRKVAPNVHKDKD